MSHVLNNSSHTVLHITIHAPALVGLEGVLSDQVWRQCLTLWIAISPPPASACLPAYTYTEYIDMDMDIDTG